MTADLQDAVALAGEVKRTEIEASAKRLYEALQACMPLAEALQKCSGNSIRRVITNTITEDLARISNRVSYMVHEDDCE